jgi:hypothetical protein
VRNVFAQEVWKKYFHDDASHGVRTLPADLISSIFEGLQVAPRPSTDLFTAARDHVSAELHSIFHARIVPSPEYAVYLSLMQLPDDLTRGFKKNL